MSERRCPICGELYNSHTVTHHGNSICRGEEEPYFDPRSLDATLKGRGIEDRQSGGTDKETEKKEAVSVDVREAFPELYNEDGTKKDSGGDKSVQVEGNSMSSPSGNTVLCGCSDSKPPEPKCEECSNEGFCAISGDSRRFCKKLNFTYYKPKEDRLPGGTGREKRLK